LIFFYYSCNVEPGLVWVPENLCEKVITSILLFCLYSVHSR
jgi:hypothetical protein